VDLQSPSPYRPKCEASRGKRVAVIGAGPAGLAAAYYLAQDGFECTIFDDHDEPGGMLRYGVPEASLPREVLAAEIAQIQKLGVTFRLGTRVGVAISMDEIRGMTRSSLPGGRRLENAGLSASGLTEDDRQPGPFDECTQHVRQRRRGPKRRLAVRAVADGKEAAVNSAVPGTGRMGFSHGIVSAASQTAG
jgi:hypothetical protein